jgi:hypothetical protein
MSQKRQGVIHLHCAKAGTQVWSLKFGYGLRPIDLKHRSPPDKQEYCGASATDP